MKSTSVYSRLLSLFFILILAVPVYWMARDKTESTWSLLEFRYLNPFPPFPIQDVKTSAKKVLQRQPYEAWQILGTQFKSGLFPKQLETAASDQFPLRSSLIQSSYGFDRLMIRLGYAFLDDPAIPVDLKGYQIFETRGEIPALFYFPAKFKEASIKKLDNTLNVYRTLIQSQSDINFYVFYIEEMKFSSVNPLISYQTSPADGQPADYFLSRAPQELSFGMLRFSSLDDFKKYMFRTDNHWNIHGTLHAYEMIYQMLARNYPEISPMFSHDQFYTFPDIGFHGFLARYAVYQIQPPDPFEVVLVDLPPYRILDKDGNDKKINKMDEYFAGEYSRKPFTNHYMEFYGWDEDFHEYVFENGSTRNLLIIGDSFVNSIELLLASHYKHTYSVDIRNYPDKTFSLSEFLIDHEVNDVLFLGGDTETIMHTWTINP